METANEKFAAEKAPLEEEIRALRAREEEVTQRANEAELRIQALEPDLQHAREQLLEADALRQQVAGAERELADLRAQLRDRVLEIERASGEIQRRNRTLSYTVCNLFTGMLISRVKMTKTKMSKNEFCF